MFVVQVQYKCSTISLTFDSCKFKIAASLLHSLYSQHRSITFVHINMLDKCIH